ncbi:MAG: IclR family transcriptional regulator [Chloroflexi bacterium]|nr:IclR family transcriptional regulator [Chloroflexota bacterium]
MPEAPANSLRRALALLDALASDEARAQGGWGVNRLSAHLGRDASQISRTLRVLAETGYVERDPDSLRYRIGWHVFALAARAVDKRLLDAARPIIRRLAGADLGERIHLTVRSGPDVLTILTEGPTARSVQAMGWVGRLVPAWNTASGRALVIDLGKDELADLLSTASFSGGGPNAPNDVADLHARIVVARRIGYVTVEDEFEDGLSGAAAPIRDVHGRVVAALNVSGPTFRLRERLTLAGKTVQAAANELSAHLGWEGQVGTEIGPARVVPGKLA